jgi:pimeloyl-ACP methyl ester carboxylesterase
MPQETSPTPSPSFYITLVYGTFRDQRIWDSRFLETLERALGGSVVFDKGYSWTGKNSQDVRVEAGHSLQKYILALMKAQPHAEHFVIGHSHGGNIALYAIGSDLAPTFTGDNLLIKGKVSGVICLGTPFLDVRPRRAWPTAGLILLSLVAAIAAPLLYLALPLYMFTAIWLLDIDSSNAIYKVPGWLLFLALHLHFFIPSQAIRSCRFLLGLFLVLFYEVPKRFLSPHQARILARYPAIRLRGVRLLYVFFEGKDSAHRWLSLWAALADSARKALGLVILPIAIMGSFAVLWEVWQSYGPLPIPSMAPDMRNPLLDQPWRATAYLIWSLMWVSIGVVVAGFLGAVVESALALIGMLRNGFWSFGFQTPWANWLISVNSSQDPIISDPRENIAIPHVCNIDEMRNEASLLGLIFRKYHSFYYRSPAIAKSIAEWMLSVSKERNAATTVPLPESGQRARSRQA